MAEAPLLERATRLKVFSLKKISLRYFSTILCNSQELIGLIMKCGYSEDIFEKRYIKYRRGYKNVYDKANELFSEIGVIGIYTDKILEMLWPVTYSIIRWKFVYAPTIDGTFLQYFHWTYQGRIDNIRTAKYILENKLIPVYQRFRLACKLCLDDEIHETFIELTLSDHHFSETEEGSKDYPLLQYWLRKLVTELVDVIGDDFHKALLCAVKMGCLEAVKYLFSKIPESEKSANAVICSDVFVPKLNKIPFLEEDESDIGYFLFSQMTESDQQTFLNSHPSVVLLFLLYSPGQKVFLEIFKDTLSVVSRGEVKALFLLIFYKLYVNIFKDYNYRKLFISVWEILDDPLKKYLGENFYLEGLFCELIATHFRFLLHKRPKNKAKKWNVSAKLFRFNKDKWRLLGILIRNEMVTMQSLTSQKSRALKLLFTRKCNKHAWRRLMKFVSDNRPKKNQK